MQAGTVDMRGAEVAGLLTRAHIPDCCRWHLAVLGEKESNLYLANGLMLTFLFFSARVICYGAGLWHLWGLR